jgi:hypothetical protein
MFEILKGPLFGTENQRSKGKLSKNSSLSVMDLVSREGLGTDSGKLEGTTLDIAGFRSCGQLTAPQRQQLRGR